MGPSEGMMRCRTAWLGSKSCAGRRHHPPNPCLWLRYGHPWGLEQQVMELEEQIMESRRSRSLMLPLHLNRDFFHHFYQCQFPSLGTAPHQGWCQCCCSEVPWAFQSLAEYLLPGTTLLGGDISRDFTCVGCSAGTFSFYSSMKS